MREEDNDAFRIWFLENYAHITAHIVADNGWGPWYQREAVNYVSDLPMLTLPSVVIDYLREKYPAIGQIVPKEYVYRKPRHGDHLRPAGMPTV